MTTGGRLGRRFVVVADADADGWDEVAAAVDDPVADPMGDGPDDAVADPVEAAFPLPRRSDVRTRVSPITATSASTQTTAPTTTRPAERRAGLRWLNVTARF